MIPDKFYNIIKIFKDEIEKYYINDNNGTINIINFDGNIKKTYSIDDFINISEKTLKIIKNQKKRSFEIPETESFLHKIEINKFKGSSNKKEDIKLEIMDNNTDKNEILTFSIKSELGSKATILNASKRTNFIYKINNITKKDVESLNDMEGRKVLKKRFSQIYKNYSCEFIKINDETFE